MTGVFTAAERELIRRTFGISWGEPYPLSAGIWLRRWASGPHQGRPKLGKVVQGLLDRGLVEIIDPERGFPSARFTAAGLEAPRARAAEIRQLDPAKSAFSIGAGGCQARSGSVPVER